MTYQRTTFIITIVPGPVPCEGGLCHNYKSQPRPDFGSKDAFFVGFWGTIIIFVNNHDFVFV